MRANQVISSIGAWLISFALVTMGFAAFQVFGTAVVADRAQQDLSDQFEASAGDSVDLGFTFPEIIVQDGQTSAGTPSGPDGGAVPAGDQIEVSEVSSASLFAELGAPIAKIDIADIGLSQVVVLGDRRQDLAVGPGISPLLAAPGSSESNVVIAGHRTTHGGPFRHIDDLNNGALITLTTMYGVFEYKVTGSRIVAPNDPNVLIETGSPTLTLYTCNPEYSTRERLVVTAEPTGPMSEFPIRFAVVPEAAEPTLQVTTSEVQTVVAPTDATGTETAQTDAGGPSEQAPATVTLSPTPVTVPLGERLASVYDTPAMVALQLTESVSWSTDRNAWAMVAIAAFLMLVFWRIAVGMWASGGIAWRVSAGVIAVVAVLPAVLWFYINFAAVTPAGF